MLHLRKDLTYLPYIVNLVRIKAVNCRLRTYNGCSIYYYIKIIIRLHRYTNIYEKKS